jgi:hypothetical protein
VERLWKDSTILLSCPRQQIEPAARG